MRRAKLIALSTALALTGAACTSGNAKPSSVSQDKAAANANLDRLNDAQPVPSFSWSQLRQNLIEINRAQAETTQTTTFFFNMGVASPVMSCPSIGYPIPTTMQLTNPLQEISHGSYGQSVVGQAEQTGVYTGDSTGTYVICVNAQGQAYGTYWEGFVYAITGPAEWDATAGQVKLVGPPSFEFTNGKG